MHKQMVITVILKKSKKSQNQAEKDLEMSRQWQPYFKWLKRENLPSYGAAFL